MQLILLILILILKIKVAECGTVQGQTVYIQTVPKVKENFLTCTKKIPQGQQKSFDCTESIKGAGDLNAYDRIVSSKNINFNQSGDVEFKGEWTMQSSDQVVVYSMDLDELNFIIAKNSAVHVRGALKVVSRFTGKLNSKIMSGSRLEVSSILTILGVDGVDFTLNSFLQCGSLDIVSTEGPANVRLGKGARLFLPAKTHLNKISGSDVSLTMEDKTSYIVVKNSNFTIRSPGRLSLLFGNLCVEKSLNIESETFSMDKIKFLPGTTVKVGGIYLRELYGIKNYTSFKVPKQIKVDKNVVCSLPPEKTGGSSGGNVEVKSCSIDLHTQFAVTLTILINMARFR